MGGIILEEHRKDEILAKASEVNAASEKYQLIHATFAIEKLFKDKIQQTYAAEFSAIREELLEASDADKQQELMHRAKKLQKESTQKIRVIVEYLPQIKYGSARITKTENNNFQIILPKEMENIRKTDGTIDFEKLKDLRRLMAHELGHIMLHSGVLDEQNVKDVNDGSDEEADFFAETLIDLRKQRNLEIHEDSHYREI